MSSSNVSRSAPDERPRDVVGMENGKKAPGRISNYVWGAILLVLAFLMFGHH